MEQDFKNKKESVTHKVGDSIEKLGQKITNAGAPSVGKAVYNAGNKIEHMSEKKEDDKKVVSSPSDKKTF